MVGSAAEELGWPTTAHRVAELLFVHPQIQIKSIFEEARSKLGIVDQFLHRLRHGGASHDRATHAGPFDVAKKRGRRASDESLKRCEMGVRLQVFEADLRPELLAACHRWSKDLLQFLQSPSSLPS